MSRSWRIGGALVAIGAALVLAGPAHAGNIWVIKTAPRSEGFRVVSAICAPIARNALSRRSAFTFMDRESEAAFLRRKGIGKDCLRRRLQAAAGDALRRAE